MELKVFDVEHGACALLSCDNGARLMIDCGHNSTTHLRASSRDATVSARRRDSKDLGLDVAQSAMREAK